MFLHLSVILFTGGPWYHFLWNPRNHPKDSTPPLKDGTSPWTAPLLRRAPPQDGTHLHTVGKHPTGMLSCYQPQLSWAKVMFLQMSVILSTRGVFASVHAGIPPPGADTPPKQTTPREQTPPWEQTPSSPWSRPPWSRHPQSRHPPPGSRLRHTVNERPVCILLECILVMVCVCSTQGYKSKWPLKYWALWAHALFCLLFSLWKYFLFIPIN